MEFGINNPPTSTLGFYCPVIIFLPACSQTHLVSQAAFSKLGGI